MHKNSHTISKIKPKIRIIHIFAPEIIKTDAENFRELVQKLTGKPSEEKKYCKKKSKSEGIREQEYSRSTTSSGSGLSSEDCSRMITIKKKEVKINNGEFSGLDMRIDHKVKEEVGGCGGSSDESCGGWYLGGFSDLEGFISEIGGFPLFPLNSTHNMQGFEQHQLL